MPATATPRQKPKSARKSEGMPPYNVILLDDNDHSYDYVILMLKSVFGHAPEKGFELAKEVDANGRVVVMTTNLEVAEMKRDEVHAFGPDPLIPRCKGSMSATVEPA
ncbi:MAG: ATP-dependent Clp protease adaptor ClpS [Actinomycetota bacterium]|jgi:ATP-dependent Clp protease adaptor protein ClpS|nr:ATP-dependent Clp protease adaptor ClpS [Actinomycetota bacterium]